MPSQNGRVRDAAAAEGDRPAAHGHRVPVGVEHLELAAHEVGPVLAGDDLRGHPRWIPARSGAQTKPSAQEAARELASRLHDTASRARARCRIARSPPPGGGSLESPRRRSPPGGRSARGAVPASVAAPGGEVGHRSLETVPRRRPAVLADAPGRGRPGLFAARVAGRESRETNAQHEGRDRDSPRRRSSAGSGTRSLDRAVHRVKGSSHHHMPRLGRRPRGRRPLERARRTHRRGGTPAARPGVAAVSEIFGPDRGHPGVARGHGSGAFAASAAISPQGRSAASCRRRARGRRRRSRTWTCSPKTSWRQSGPAPYSLARQPVGSQPWFRSPSHRGKRVRSQSPRPPRSPGRGGQVPPSSDELGLELAEGPPPVSVSSSSCAAGSSGFKRRSLSTRASTSRGGAG